MKSCLFTTLLLTLSFLNGCASPKTGVQTDWQLILHHDSQGNIISGSKTHLIQLVTEGRPVRILWPIRDDFVHVLSGNFLTIMTGEVYAQASSIVRQIPDKATRRFIDLDAKEQSHWTAIFSTTGNIRSFQSQVGKLNSYQYPLKWYVYTQGDKD